MSVSCSSRKNTMRKPLLVPLLQLIGVGTVNCECAWYCGGWVRGVRSRLGSTPHSCCEPSERIHFEPTLRASIPRACVWFAHVYADDKVLKNVFSKGKRTGITGGFRTSASKHPTAHRTLRTGFAGSVCVPCPLLGEVWRERVYAARLMSKPVARADGEQVEHGAG